MYFKKYYYQFEDPESRRYRVEIWENNDDPLSMNIDVTTQLGSDVVTPGQDISLFHTGDVLTECSAFTGDVTITYVNTNNSTFVVDDNALAGGTTTAKVTFVEPTAVEIIGDNTPAKIKYSSPFLYEPIKASGAELNIISETNMQFINLYSEDMLKFTVLIYKVTYVNPVWVDELLWTGFLNSENYSEDFSMLNNYPVNLLANDGFNLLERVKYASYNSLNNTVTKYTGFQTLWTTFITVIQKLNLPWLRIYVGLSITIPGVAIGANETVLHKLWLNNENWYDEDGVPSSCREVLEKILNCLGAFIIQRDGSLFITDTNYLGNGTQSFKVFTYAYENTTYFNTLNVTLNLGDISDLGVMSNNQTFEVESGINKQKVVYSPYEDEVLMDYKADDDTFSGSLGIVNAYPTWPEWDYTEQSFSTSEEWTSSNNGRFVKITGTGSKNSGRISQKLKLTPYANWLAAYNDRLAFTFKTTLPVINESALRFLRLDMSIFLMTYAKWGANLTDPIIPVVETKVHIDIIHSITVDGISYTKKYIYKLTDGSYSVASQGWTSDMNTESYLQFRRETQYEILNERDIDLSQFDIVGTAEAMGGTIEIAQARPFLIPINGLGAGKIEIKIYDAVSKDIDGGWSTGYQPDPQSGPIYRPTVYINSVGLSVTDKNGNELNKLDLEYTSELNSMFANEGKEVNTYLGTNTNSFPLQRGSLMLRGNDNKFPYVEEFTKEGLTAQPEKLLLRSIKSNYGEANVKLSLDLPPVKSLGYITYNNYLAGKKLAIIENTMDLGEGISSVTVREIHNDFSTIS